MYNKEHETTAMSKHVSNEPFVMLNLYNAKRLIGVVIVSINAYQSFKKRKNLT
jgi:hypothetical protein